MAGGDEDDDETLIADLGASDESSDGGQTLVAALPQDDGDATLVAAPIARLAPRGPLPPAAGMPPAPRAPLPPAAAPRLPPPPATAPPRTGPPPPHRAGSVRPAPLLAVPADDALDRRALPFAIEAPAPLAQPGFVPVTRTQEMPNIAHEIAPRKVPSVPSRPPSAPPPPAPPPPARTPSAPPAARGSSAPPPRASTPAPMPSVPAPPPIPAASRALPPPPPAARPPEDSVIVPPQDGTPPFVIRYLLVCGVLTALGLIALIVLEL